MLQPVFANGYSICHKHGQGDLLAFKIRSWGEYSTLIVQVALGEW